MRPLEQSPSLWNSGVGMRFFSKTNFLIIFIVFSSKVLAGVGDTYVCKEKETNLAGFKAEFILYWNPSSFEIKDKVEKGTVDASRIQEFTFNTPNYFISSFPYENGYLILSFDGINYTNHFIEKDRTYVSIFACSKF